MILDTFDNGYPADPSLWQQHYLLLYITEGAGTLTLSFETLPILKAHLYFLPPGALIRLEGSGKGIAIRFDPTFIPDGQNTLDQLFTPDHIQPLPVTEGDRPAVTSLTTLLQKEYDRTPPDEAILHSLLHILLLYGVRMRSGIVRKKRTWRQERMAQITALIEAHYRSEHYAPFYARTLELSTHYLNTLLKRHLGKTLTRLVLERILTEAKRELIHTSKSVRDIAESLGFADPSYFARLFKRETGQTPSAFREGFKKYR